MTATSIRKWDLETKRQFEMSIQNPIEVQNFKNIMEFMRHRFQVLEALKQIKEIFEKNPEQKTEAL